MNKIQKCLNDLIYEMDSCGGGGPGYAELFTMARAYRVLEALDLKIKNQKHIKSTLEGENNYDCNWLEDVPEL
jgi:hypothetical protein